MKSMLKDCKITRVMNSVVAGTSEQKSSVLDMAGFDSVMFLLALGDVTSGSVVTLAAYENTANSTSSPTPTAVTGGSATYTATGASDADNLLLVVDVIRPAQRYVYADVTRTTANAVIDGVFAIQYNAHDGLPITQGATVLASALSTPEV